ncbi:hypothetical protein HanIR_Chr04g0201231 [Helianthus annuus]|nr:hypothetical protein HanIR_Chr04g0201231 [Helianthus annuus]
MRADFSRFIESVSIRNHKRVISVGSRFRMIFHITFRTDVHRIISVCEMLILIIIFQEQILERIPILISFSRISI